MALVPAERSPRWSDLRKRLVSAVILAPVVLVCLWHGGMAYHVMVIVAGLGLSLEWVHLRGDPPSSWPAILVPLSVLTASIATVYGQAQWGAAVLVVAAVAARFTGRAGGGLAAMGIIYVGFGTLALLWLRDDALAGRINLLFVLLLIWASDITAYLTGRLIGGPRLAPSISPGKTWSGAAGGLAGAVAAATILAFAVQPPISMLWLLGISIVLGIVAQLGDLLESRVKRQFGVKDSGHLIPGHGGLLDRLDALLAAAPVAAMLALAAGRGVVLWQ
ncbi:MAG: phosphatidate cytidylyltransferase [Acetobacteraceae bacterium]